jgi:hypothetical protein
MGSDFTHSNARMWFNNLDKVGLADLNLNYTCDAFDIRERAEPGCR